MTIHELSKTHVIIENYIIKIFPSNSNLFRIFYLNQILIYKKD